MSIKNLDNKLPFLLLAFLPASIIVGATVSLSIIVLFCLIIIFYYLKDQEIEFQNLYLIYFFSILYLYLIINTFLALDPYISIRRNLGFVRYILLFLSINYLFLKLESKRNLFFVWIITIGILIFDSYFQKLFGFNTLGWKSGIGGSGGQRIVSFFKDEPVVGSYLFSFFLLLSASILQFSESKNKKILFYIFFLIGLFLILLTGERSSFIKAILSSLLFFLLIYKFSIKKIITITTLFIIVFITAVNFSTFLKLRYYEQFKIMFFKDNKLNLENNTYFMVYNSGYLVFKENKIFGVGAKNYGEYASQRNSELRAKSPLDHSFIPTTHPHQIYLEFLSEHGIFGTLIILSLFIFIFFKMLKIIILSRNYIQIACFCYLISNFIPILPSGSFFSDFSSNLFWINFSVFFAISDKTNIFKIK